jgi:mRNA-degrading endonuclease toxin of MazEF toxin-antitoxin module
MKCGIIWRSEKVNKRPNTPKFGEVYLIKFHPAYGQEFKKFHPGVVLNNKTNEIDERFVLVAPLTSKTEDMKKHEILVPKNSFLKQDSVILTWYLYTMDATRLEIKLGELTPQIKENLKKELIEFIKS